MEKVEEESAPKEGVSLQAQGAEGVTQAGGRPEDSSAHDSRKSSSSRSSRKSFRLDYRLEEDVTKSKRDKSGRFVNPWPTWKFPSYFAFVKFFMLEKDHSNVPSSKEVLDKELPVMEPYFVQNPQLVGQTGSGMRVTWLGHATVLVEMDDLVVLTDPVFSQRASPLQFWGPSGSGARPARWPSFPRSTRCSSATPTTTTWTRAR
ncbi:hypothetical protein AGOR_G00185900 [Albula goreensis]|uniref:N-acyl-phosphatidylethanolamine-hydrolyzing phospholipase D n=1 Tax=Albula goreensis TaxID=1534307 RepID=A0A8T3CXP8_9TELE|nr:hypothetical protein AGOR_G00185900 [Albula goreensis]